MILFVHLLVCFRSYCPYSRGVDTLLAWLKPQEYLLGKNVKVSRHVSILLSRVEKVENVDMPVSPFSEKADIFAAGFTWPHTKTTTSWWSSIDNLLDRQASVYNQFAMVIWLWLLSLGLRVGISGRGWTSARRVKTPRRHHTFLFWLGFVTWSFCHSKPFFFFFFVSLLLSPDRQR